MNRDEPLTPEERELARLLGRRNDQSPPPALDATILAAARAAVDAPAGQAATGAAAAPRTRRPQRRWPAVFGIAASMVFAVGIAWQMRPEPPPIPAEAQVAAAPAAEMAADASAEGMAYDSAAADAAVAEPASAPMAVAPPAPAMAKEAPAAASAAVPKRAPAAPPPAPAPMMAPTPPPTAAADAAFSAPPVASAAPPALDTYSAPMPAAAAEAAPAAVRTRKTTAATAGALEAQQGNTQDRIDLTSSKRESAARSAPGVMRRASNAGLSAEAVQAEVQADAELPRRQWLRKIRERRDAGQRDLARASLERYLQQYPETRLPKDLRSLLDD